MKPASPLSTCLNVVLMLRASPPSCGWRAFDFGENILAGNMKYAAARWIGKNTASSGQ